MGTVTQTKFHLERWVNGFQYLLPKYRRLMAKENETYWTFPGVLIVTLLVIAWLKCFLYQLIATRRHYWHWIQSFFDVSKCKELIIEWSLLEQSCAGPVVVPLNDALFKLQCHLHSQVGKVGIFQVDHIFCEQTTSSWAWAFWIQDWINKVEVKWLVLDAAPWLFYTTIAIA